MCNQETLFQDFFSWPHDRGTISLTCGSQLGVAKLQHKSLFSFFIDEVSDWRVALPLQNKVEDCLTKFQNDLTPD